MIEVIENSTCNTKTASIWFLACSKQHCAELKSSTSCHTALTVLSQLLVLLTCIPFWEILPGCIMFVNFYFRSDVGNTDDTLYHTLCKWHCNPSTQQG